MGSEDFWRKYINSLDAQMPDVGDAAPPLEITKVVKKSTRNEANRKVTVQRIVTEIYVYSDGTEKVGSSLVAQSIRLLGEMTLAEAVKLAKAAKPPEKKE